MPPPSAATNLDGSLGLSFVAYQIVIVAAEIVRLICGAHRPRTYRLALGRRLTTFLSPGLLKLRQLLVTDSPRNTRTRRSSRLYVSAPESLVRAAPMSQIPCMCVISHQIRVRNLPPPAPDTVAKSVPLSGDIAYVHPVVASETCAPFARNGSYPWKHYPCGS